jgi:hypothetical protein
MKNYGNIDENTVQRQATMVDEIIKLTDLKTKVKSTSEVSNPVQKFYRK